MQVLRNGNGSLWLAALLTLVQLCQDGHSFSTQTTTTTTTLPRIRIPTPRTTCAFRVGPPSTPRKPSFILAAAASSSSSTANTNSKVDKAGKALFQQHCDKSGAMSLKTLKGLDFVSELLEDGDLLEEEMDDMWKSAAKIPGGDDNVERIDADSFVQLYLAVDDLFESDADEDNDEEDQAVKKTPSKSQDDNDDSMKEELASIFKSIANSDGKLSRKALLKWDEIQNMMKDGLIGNDEFDRIWKQTPKSATSKKQIDMDGFLKLNAALDDLFDFEDLDDEEEEVEEIVTAASSTEIIDDEDISPEALFKALVGADGLVGKDALKRWGELQEMLSEGELMPLEFENIFDEMANDSNKLNEAGFIALYNKIDSLFEEDEDDDAATGGDNTVKQQKPAAPAQQKQQKPAASEQKKPAAPTKSVAKNTKEDLLSFLVNLNRDEERLPCGLESTDREQKYVQDLVGVLESDPANIVRQKQGAIEMTDLDGEWELLYSSSAAMAYNKGLSGLGGSFPNGSFGGLKMKLIESKYMTDVEYTERINVVPDSASFDVTVNGVWELRSSVSIFTGQPSIVLTVIPEKVTYGPTSTRADHWKSLGPTNMLDVSYLDENIRVMRGNTSTDSILVFKRTK